MSLPWLGLRLTYFLELLQDLPPREVAESEILALLVPSRVTKIQNHHVDPFGGPRRHRASGQLEPEVGARPGRRRTARRVRTDALPFDPRARRRVEDLHLHYPVLRARRVLQHRALVCMSNGLLVPPGPYSGRRGDRLIDLCGRRVDPHFVAESGHADSPPRSGGSGHRRAIAALPPS